MWTACRNLALIRKMLKGLHLYRLTVRESKRENKAYQSQEIG